MPFPGNTKYCFSLIVALANFKIIPVDKILKYLGVAKRKAANEWGYTDNFLTSMGFSLFVIAGLIILSIIGFFVYKIVRKNNCMEKMLTFAANKVLFNSILRSIIQQYMPLSLATLYSLKQAQNIPVRVLGSL